MRQMYERHPEQLSTTDYRTPLIDGGTMATLSWRVM
jgi:hypothetical protein